MVRVMLHRLLVATMLFGALASGGFLTEARNIVLLGPPGTGKTHLATALGVAAARHGQRVLFATATEWITRLTEAHRSGSLPRELARLRRFGLIIVLAVASYRIALTAKMVRQYPWLYERAGPFAGSLARGI